MREVFNGVRYVARSGCPWRLLPNDFAPWAAVYQQMRRWIEAGCFETLVADVQSIVREWAGRKGEPTAVCSDSRTLQSTPESGARAGYEGAKRRKGSKVHIAVDTLGHLLAVEAARDSLVNRARIRPATPNDSETLRQIAIKATPWLVHKERYRGGDSLYAGAHRFGTANSATAFNLKLVGEG